MDEIGESEPKINFRLLYTITQAIGFLIIVLVLLWIEFYCDGLGWSSSVKLQFNWHPLLMTIGMIFLYANSILVYRGFRMARKKNLKYSHAAIHLTVLVAVIIALVAVFDSHNYAATPIPNLYSLHSWVGLTAVILFACQWVAGFVAYLSPVLAEPLKRMYMPLHIYFGLLGYGFAAAAALMGFAEKAAFNMPKTYKDLPREAVLINSIGLLVLLFSALVVYLVTETKYKRQPLPEDQMLLSSSTE